MHAALTPTKPLTPEEGGIQFMLTIPTDDLRFRIAHADGEYQFQVWEDQTISFTCPPTRSYAIALTQLLEQLAVDELDGLNEEHNRTVLNMFSDTLKRLHAPTEPLLGNGPLFMR